MSFSHADLHHLRAAEGWLELGDWRSASEELARVAPESDKESILPRLRFRIYASAKEWSLASAAAESLVKACPEDKEAWINRSYALHELKQTETAEMLLSPALEKFPDEPIIPYNLACYACVLGNLEKARQFLKQAFSLGNAEDLKRMAHEDPDLAALNGSF